MKTRDALVILLYGGTGFRSVLLNLVEHKVCVCVGAVHYRNETFITKLTVVDNVINVYQCECVF